MEKTKPNRFLIIYNFIIKLSISQTHFDNSVITLIRFIEVFDKAFIYSTHKIAYT